MPVKLKRGIGRQVMIDAAAAGGTVTVSDGRKFHVIEDRLFLRVCYEKNYEPLLSDIASRLLEKGDTIVDVGANFGWYSTLFSRCSCPGGKVMSYEPSPYSLKNLTNNIELNGMEGSIQVRPVCVGEFSGTIALEQDTASESGLAHIVQYKADTTVDVPIVTLDDELSSEIGNIAYIKIDVEGHELSVLKGAYNILCAVDQPVIQIELNDEALERAGCSRTDAVQFLKSLGYSFWEVVSNNPGILKETGGQKCSDAFCFGHGRFSERLKSVSVSAPQAM